MLAVKRATPILTLADGRLIYGYTATEYQTILALMRRYYAWVDSGRQADPWQSGVASARNFDRPLIKHHKPSGGYDPTGRAAEPEPDIQLAALDAIITALPVHTQLMLWWKLRDRLTIAAIAERLSISDDAVSDQWRKLMTRLYWRVCGG